MARYEFETLLLEEHGAVDWLTLNRPDSLNALNPTMVSELTDYFRDLATRQDRRIVVLRGAGRAFCAGLDLKAGGDAEKAIELGTVQEGLVFQRAIAEIYLAMHRCPQPIVALISGAACGGGFSLALAADIRIADSTAKMNCAYIRLGVGGCDMGSSYFLPRLVGSSLAAELILTGKFIDAQRALALGLVFGAFASEVLRGGFLAVPPGQVEADYACGMNPRQVKPFQDIQTRSLSTRAWSTTIFSPVTRTTIFLPSAPLRSLATCASESAIGVLA